MQLGYWPLAAEHPDDLALVAHAAGGAPGSEKRYTHAELLAAQNQLVHGLRSLGLQKGDAVAAMLGNEAAMVELVLAVSQAGLYLVPLNVNLAAPEAAYILADSEAKAFICSPAQADLARRAADEAHLPSTHRFCTGPAEGFRPYEAIKEGQPTSLPADRIAGLVMNYTSGTTGRPKGVRRPLAPIPPEALGTGFAQFLMLFGITMRDGGVHLVCSPLYHTAVLNFCTYHLHAGHTIVVMDKWAPEEMLRCIERYKVTTSHMVPTHFNRLLALPDETKTTYDLSSMRHMIHSAAPCPVPVKHRMLEWWGPVVYEYYSASEGGGTTATPKDWLAHPGTVGNPWPISQIRILDDDGQPVPAGKVGTVYIHMGPHQFKYHKDEKKTQDAWKDGFFTVGDAGYLDEEGFLFLVDRKADMIISGGVNIYPAEIESVMLGHPQIADVAVFGIPDDDWGEQVKAVVEPVEGVVGTSALAEEILAFCAERLATYKRPKSIDFTAALPRDPNGKLYKRRLRDPYWAGRERKI